MQQEQNATRFTDLIMQAGVDQDTLTEQKMLQVRKDAKAQSMEHLKHMVAAAEKADPRIRKQIMFGSDHQKELVFNQHHEKIKEQFLRKMYNITKCKYQKTNCMPC